MSSLLWLIDLIDLFIVKKGNNIADVKRDAKSNWVQVPLP